MAARGKRPKPDRRTEILAATCRLIARDGIDGLRSATVATEAGVSVALPHYYYPTLKDLVLAAYAWDEQRTWAAFDEADGARIEPLAQLTAMFADVFELPAGALRQTLMLWHEYARASAFRDDLRVLVRGRLERWQRATVGQLQELQAEGTLAADVSADLLGLRLSVLWAGLTEFNLLGLVDTATTERIVRDSIARMGDYRPPPAAAYRPPPLADLVAAANPDERILDATLRLTGREGMKRVHFPEVAVEAGVSKSLPRYYFRTIDELHAAAFGRYDAIMREQNEARRARLDDPLERLHDGAVWEFASAPAVARARWLCWQELVRLGFVAGDIQELARARIGAQLAAAEADVRSLQDAGRCPPDGDAAAAALRIVAAASGLGAARILELASADDQLAVAAWMIADEPALAGATGLRPPRT